MLDDGLRPRQTWFPEFSRFSDGRWCEWVSCRRRIGPRIEIGWPEKRFIVDPPRG